MSEKKKSKFGIIILIVFFIFIIVKCLGAGNSSYTSSNTSYNGQYSSSSGDSKAVAKAKAYLSSSAFSKTELIDQLEFEGFSSEQATQAVNSINVDWNEQAVLKAKSYLKSMAFSYDGLVDQLKFEGFTSIQAKYGVDNSGYGISSSKSTNGVSSSTGNRDQALKMAKSYLHSTNFSRSGLIAQLEFEGFSNSDASYAASNCGADWNVQAAKCAASYRKLGLSYSELRDQIRFEGFTASQVDYAMANYSKY